MYRNLSLFRFDTAVAVAGSLWRLHHALEDYRLRDVGPLEVTTHGFVPVAGVPSATALTHECCSRIAFAVGSQTRDLKPRVVNDELAKRTQAIAAEQGRKVGGRERKRIKEDILAELLPRAFVVRDRLDGYVDAAHGWLVLDTASRARAEQAISQVREALGSFPAVPAAPDESPRVLMTQWLASGTLPAGLALGDECELRDPASNAGAIARCRRQDLDAEEIKEHLRTGKQVFRLGLVFDGRLSFVLGEDLVIRKLQFLDAVLDDLGDNTTDASEEHAARFALMTLELERLLAKLAEWFAIARPGGV